MKQMVQWKSSNLLLTMSWRGLIWHKGARFIFIFCNPLDLSSKIKVILVLCMFIIIWKNTLKNRFPSRGFWPLMLPEVRRFLRMVHGCLGSSSLYLPLDSLGSSSAWSRFAFRFVRHFDFLTMSNVIIIYIVIIILQPQGDPDEEKGGSSKSPKRKHFKCGINFYFIRVIFCFVIPTCRFHCLNIWCESTTFIDT